MTTEGPGIVDTSVYSASPPEPAPGHPPILHLPSPVTHAYNSTAEFVSMSYSKEPGIPGTSVLRFSPPVRILQEPGPEATPQHAPVLDASNTTAESYFPVTRLVAIESDIPGALTFSPSPQVALGQARLLRILLCLGHYLLRLSKPPTV